MHYAHCLGCRRHSTSSASGEPFAGTTLYRHDMSGGADTMMLSTRPLPSSPNLTPRSYSRLNSRYLQALRPHACLLHVMPLRHLPILNSHETGQSHSDWAWLLHVPSAPEQLPLALVLFERLLPPASRNVLPAGYDVPPDVCHKLRCHIAAAQVGSVSLR